MPVTRTQTTILSPVSQAGLADEIKAAFLNAGFNLVEDYVATDRLLVFSFILDSTKTFGTVFLRVRITSGLGITQTIGTGWNTSTKAIANESPATTAVGFVSTSPLDLITYSRGTEAKLIQLSQGISGTTFLGFLRPENKPSWWNENTHPYAFIPHNNSNPNFFGTLFSPSLNPYGNTNYGLLFSTSLNTANPITGKRDVLAGLVLLSAGFAGIAGKTSGDIAIAASNGLTKLDTLEVFPGSEEYILLFAGSNGIALRSV